LLPKQLRNVIAEKPDLTINLYSMATSPALTGSIGRKIERIRKVKGINQETLAHRIGMTRQNLSKLEQAETIDEDKLEQIAKGLGVTAEAIRHFNEDAVINNVGNEFHEGSYLINYNFNPIEKIVELYDALLKSEREKNEILQKLLDQK
jgi:transcriptional regulator with XRE-family HTH domain